MARQQGPRSHHQAQEEDNSARAVPFSSSSVCRDLQIPEEARVQGGAELSVHPADDTEGDEGARLLRLEVRLGVPAGGEAGRDLVDKLEDELGLRG